MEDESLQIRKMCDLWWDATIEVRPLSEWQRQYQAAGPFHVKGRDNLLAWWLDVIRSFLRTPFEFRRADGILESFVPSDLDASLKRRLVGQLAVGIGLFYRDWMGIYTHFFEE